MVIHDIYKSDAQLLAKMMDISAGQQRLWQPEELGAIFEHQLSAVVQFDLSGLDPGLAEKLQTLSAAEGLLIKSFMDLFHHPHPPVELLELTKRFAKASRSHPDSPLPDEVASLLYFLSIVVAMTKCGRRITQLDDESLRSGLMWALEQPWLDEQTRGLLHGGLNALSPNRNGKAE